MAYNITNWIDRKTVVNASRLNNMEHGIQDAHSSIEELQEQIEQINSNQETTTELFEQINNERGYLNTKILHDGADYNSVTTNGKYRIFKGVNAPIDGDFMFVFDVTVEDSTHISQLASLVKGESRVLYHRACVEGVWSDWARIIVDKEINSIQTEIESVKTSIESIQTEATTLKEKVSENETEIVNVKQKVTSIEGEIDSIQETIGTNGGSSGGSLLDRISTVEQDVDSLEERVSTNETNISSLKQEDISINQKIETNKSEITSVESALTTHKEDRNAHVDIRKQIGNVNNLLTTSKEVVGAINEIFSGSNKVTKALVKGSDRVLRIIAETETNVFDAGVILNTDTTELYLMGLRIFEEKDYTISGSIITLESTLLPGEYLDILSMDEVIVNLGTNTIVETHKRVVAEKPMTTFEVEGNITYGSIYIYQMGVRLYEDFDYTVDRALNEVTLVQPLEIGDYIDYTIRTNSGTDITEIENIIDEMDGKVVEIGSTLEEVSSKLDSSVKNLDSSVKNVNQQISVLNNDRGYLNSKVISNTYDIDTLTLNGIYIWEYGENTKKPDGIGAYYIFVNSILNTYVFQEMTKSWDDGKKFYRIQDNGVWQPWIQVATTEQINVLEDSKVNKSSYFVEDFNNIGNNERFLRSGANTPNAPSVGQFTGVRGIWDSNFDFVVGADISGVFWIRKSKEAWQQIATTQRTLVSQYYNGWSAWASAYGIRLDVVGGRCICSGILSIGVKDNGTLICTIPEGFRPKLTEPRLLKANNGDNLHVTINLDGTTKVDHSAGTPWDGSATLLDFTCSWEV